MRDQLERVLIWLSRRLLNKAGPEMWLTKDGSCVVVGEDGEIEKFKSWGQGIQRFKTIQTAIDLGRA